MKTNNKFKNKNMKKMRYGKNRKQITKLYLSKQLAQDDN